MCTSPVTRREDSEKKLSISQSMEDNSIATRRTWH